MALRQVLARASFLSKKLIIPAATRASTAGLRLFASKSESKPKIHYFPVSGRGEFIKLILEEAGQKYEFVPHAPGSNTQPPLVDRLAYGQLPLYEDDGLSLVQSGTIIRYVAKKYSLYPSDLKVGAQAEMVVDGTLDFIGKYFGAALYNTITKDDFSKKVIPQWLGYFTKILKANNNGKEFVAGTKFSFADLALFQVLDVSAKWVPGSLDSFQLLKDYHARIGARPKVAGFLKSDRRLNP